MENLKGTLPEAQEEDDGPDSSTSRQISDHDLHSELKSLHQLQASAMEGNLKLLQSERDDAVTRYADAIKIIGEISREKDFLQERIREFEALMRGKEDEFAERIDKEAKEREKLEKEVEIYRERIEEVETARERSNELFSKCLDSFLSAKESLGRFIENVDEEKLVADEKFSNGVKESDSMCYELQLNEELMVFMKLVAVAEQKVNTYKKLRNKEKKELENSVVSLTEENRDINSLLRVALLEKESVEKRLKLNSEQKRVALLQIAERGLQRVGFGFMTGSGKTEHSLESSSGSKSDSSECEEEVVSLVCNIVFHG